MEELFLETKLSFAGIAFSKWSREYYLFLHQPLNAIRNASPKPAAPKKPHNVSGLEIVPMESQGWI
jgi:hypothetical protein